MNSQKAINRATEIACRRWPQKPSAVIDTLCEKVTSDRRLGAARVCVGAPRALPLPLLPRVSLLMVHRHLVYDFSVLRLLFDFVVY